MMRESDANLYRAQNIVDKIWHRKSDAFTWRLAEGRAIESFPDLSEGEAERTASQARSDLAALDVVNSEALPHELALTIKILRFQLGIEAQAMNRYWLVQDCASYPAMFPISPYGAGYLFSIVLKTFTDFSFGRPGDADRYLSLVEDYARLVNQMRQKLEGQAERGIRIPQPALAGMRGLVASQADATQKALRIEFSRLGHALVPSGFTNIVARRIEERVVPAFAALLAAIGDDYGTRAPEAVGMEQFKDGPQIYESLVAEHVSMSMTIESIHRTGHEYMDRIEGVMAKLRGSLGYSDREGFHRYLVTDHAWTARSATEMQARFDTLIRRIEPHVDALFRFRPAAPYRAARLDPKLEASMSNGYYQEPMGAHPEGVYYFNGSNLSGRTLATAPSLIFHELIPGHHFHLASQKENDLLHPLRQNLSFNAFNEGWAEYTATLAGEIGMYSDPCEQYGRHLMDAYVICRLVVDTGMNALGWSLEDARTYMREHTALSEADIRSETLRYSTDIPAQGLAYKIGEIKMLELRQKARDALGERFDIRDFHDAVLRSGGMPLQVLDWHVDGWLHAQSSDEACDQNITSCATGGSSQ